MISSRLLNSEAILNSFFEISQIQYVPGETLDIVIRLFHSERNIRFVADNPAAIVTVDFQINSTPLIPLSIPATEVAPLDRSMWTVSLTAAQTSDLAGSNIGITLDAAGDGNDISKTVIRNVLLRNTLSGDC